MRPIQAKKKYAALAIPLGLFALLQLYSWVNDPESAYHERIKRPLSVHETSRTLDQINAHTHQNETNLHEEEVNTPIFTDSPIGQNMANVLVTTGKIGPGLDEELDALIAELKKNPDAVLKEAKNAMKNLQKDNWEAKKRVLFILGEVGHESYLPLVADIVAEPLFATDFAVNDKDNHSQNPEELYYMRAILTLTQLAKENPDEGRGILLDLIKNGAKLTPPLVSYAAQSYLSLSQNTQADIEFLKTIVPERLHSQFYNFSDK